MTIHATRALLLSNLLRGGDQRRIASLLDRLDPRDLSGLLLELHDLDLRRAGRVLFAPSRAAGTVEFLTEEALDELIRTADDRDALCALEHIAVRAREAQTLETERRAVLLETQESAQQDEEVRVLPGSTRSMHWCAPSSHAT